MSAEIFLIDSNILVYAYDSSEKKKQQKALLLLEQCFQQRVPFALCLQNLAEFFFIVTTKIQQPLKEKEAEAIVKDFLAFDTLRKLQYKDSTLLTAIKFAKEYKIELWDALLAATILEDGINSIYTENVSDFRKIPQLKIINPFE